MVSNVDKLLRRTPFGWDEKGGLVNSPGMLSYIQCDGSLKYPKWIMFESGSGADMLRIEPINEKLYGPIPCWKLTYKGSGFYGTIQVNSLHLALMFFVTDYLGYEPGYQIAAEEVLNSGGRELLKQYINVGHFDSTKYSIIADDRLALPDYFLRDKDFLFIPNLLNNYICIKLDEKRCEIVRRLIQCRK